MTYLTALFALLRREGPRLLVMVVLIGVTFLLQSLFQLTPNAGHPELAHLFSVLYLFGVVIGFSHLMRRVLFNRINMQDMAKTAVTSPVGAGLVFVGICNVLCVMLVCYARLLH